MKPIIQFREYQLPVFLDNETGVLSTIRSRCRIVRMPPFSRETIEKRLGHAAEADLSIVLYNPASRGRPDHLRRACDILLETLPADRPCGIARMIGRPGEEGQVLTLGELRDAAVDMFCTVFIGNAQTRALGGKLITPRGYRDV